MVSTLEMQLPHFQLDVPFHYVKQSLMYVNKNELSKFMIL